MLVRWLGLLIEEQLIKGQLLEMEERLGEVRTQKEVAANQAGQMGIKLGTLQDPIRSMRIGWEKKLNAL
jgi:hypothetical protein